MSIDFKKELNAEQYEVVTKADGPCLVLAGAGSGKTRAITYRVAYLIEQGVPPEQILLLTFTNKAAAEMLVRAKKLVGDAATLVMGGTFHTTGYRIVVRHAAVLGLQNHLTILDSEDSRSLLAQVLKEEGWDPKNKKFPSAAIIADIYSYQRNAMIPLEEALDIKNARSFSLAPDLARIISTYEARKKASGFLDFDDLLTLWLKLLTDYPEQAAKIAGAYRYVMVDEYQDTNRVQARIVEEMSKPHGNVLAVGDDAQSIYSFRAADITNILEFDKRFKNARVFHLLTNYRSTPEILQVANHVIKQNERQIHKELRSVVSSAQKPRVVQADTGAREAEFIVEEILRQKREGHKLGDLSVLFRSTFHSQPVEFELARRGLPYEYRGGTRFFDRAHVKDVLAYLRAFTNARDTLAWQRILVQQEGIGLETAKKLYDVVSKHKDVSELRARVGELTIEKRATRGWQTLINTLNDMAGAAARGAVGDTIRAVLESAYRGYIRGEYPDDKHRVPDIEQLANFADRAQDMKTFLADTALQEQYRASRGPLEDRVVLSTIHQAKGLEWDTVFVMGLTSEGFPNQRALTEDGGLEEERRLFYVAITRARHQLYLTHSILGGRNNEFVSAPSPFLDEIDAELLQTNSGSSAEVSYEPLDADWRKRQFLSSV